MVSEASEPGSESGKRSDDRRGAARGTRAGSWSPQGGGAGNHLAARLPPRAPGSFAAAAMVTRTAPWPRGRGKRIRVLGGDGALEERRQLLPHGDGLGVEAGNHVLREMSVLREKKTGSPAASTASVSSTAKSSMPFEPGFS